MKGFEARVRRLHGRGRLNEAAAQCRRWIAADGRTVDAVFWMSRIALAMEDWSSAIALFTEASGLAPARSEIAIELGHVLYHVGRYPEAIEVYERVLERQPDLLDCRIDLALACREAFRPKAALEQLGRVLVSSGHYPQPP